MRGGVLEATLYFDELTTEVIADGKHLARELLLLAYKVKGPDRLALVLTAPWRQRPATTGNAQPTSTSSGCRGAGRSLPRPS